MLKGKDIQHILAKKGAFALYQLSILDYLNGAKSYRALAGREPQRGPIEDDPNVKTSRGSKGYDIGEKVARRVLKRRKELGGRFTNILQLAEIPYFGEDKFNDLVYTFTKIRTPIPTGLGAEFDEFIVALSNLELSAYRRGYSELNTLSAIRKLLFDEQLTPQADRAEDFKWNDVIPGARNTQPPSEWGILNSLANSVEVIKSKDVIKIGKSRINIHALILGLDAKNRPSRVVPSRQSLRVQSNQQYTTFLFGLGNTIYQELKNVVKSSSTLVQINTERTKQRFDKTVNDATVKSYADVYRMNYNKEQSLTWNLLSYYLDQKNPEKERITSFTSQLELGDLDNGIFSNDNMNFRDGVMTDVRSTAFNFLVQNGKGPLVSRMMRAENNSNGYITYTGVAAYAVDLFIDKLYLLLSLELNEPAITSWNRLEARPRREDLSRCIKAEIRDPLWMLSRQWQLGEFKGEDAGTCVEMRVDMYTSKIDQYSLRGSSPQMYDQTIPMETTVESEPIQRDVTIRQSMGMYFESMLRSKLSNFAASTITKVIDDFRDEVQFQFAVPDSPTGGSYIESSPPLLMTYASIGGGRALDGAALYDALEQGLTASTIVNSTSSANALSLVDEAASEYVDRIGKQYALNTASTSSAWSPSQLEYQFACAAPSRQSGNTILVTDEYASGHLDWYNFDFEMDQSESRSLRNKRLDRKLIKRKMISVLPGELNFPGMPRPRWWQFEDYKVDIGDIKANTNEVPKLLLAEFALVYSNDWMLIPFDVDVGSICDLKSVIVTDVFGQYTDVKPAGAGDDTDWRRWSMYSINRRNNPSNQADNRLFVPPAVVRTMESEPIEKVNFVRDEMANMVWGIERLIPDGFGGSEEGWDAGRRLYNYLSSLVEEPEEPSDIAVNDAEIRYQLGTTVPEHWIPFIPVRKGNVNSRQIQLRRAAMPRIIPGTGPERIRPRTNLLSPDHEPTDNPYPPYFLHEEEVPRSGTIVTRSWQRARWHNGRTATWLGRRVSNGRGEANSGLQYDKIIEKQVTAPV